MIYAFQIVNGLGLGMLYCILALGLSVIFGLLRFVNFAHGEIFALAAYLAFVIERFGGDFWLSIVLVPLIILSFGWALEKSLIRFTYDRSHTVQILVTFGIALVIREALIWVFGPQAHNVSTPPSLNGFISVAGFTFPVYRAFVIGLGVIITLTFWYVLERTRIGAIIRAGSEKPEMLMLLGRSTNAVFSGAFCTGVALAGFAGVMFAPLRGVDPHIGAEALGIAFIAVTIGGLGSYSGVVVASLILGVIQSVMSTAWPEGASLMLYVAMAAIILIRPRGLFGKAV
jgi:branched-chain amino acid transport system permease protein